MRIRLSVMAFVLAGFFTGNAHGQTTAPASQNDEGRSGLWGWPHSFDLPESLRGPKPPNAKGADVLVWVPRGATRIRAMILIPNNSDSYAFGGCTPLREVAAKHEMGVIYLRTFDSAIEWERKTPPEPTNINEMLNIVAEQTKIAEFRHAPWITFGKSSRGSFPFRAAWLVPDRTIATISYHAETPTWPVPDYAKLNGQSIMHVNANGDTEWGGTWYNHVRPSLLNYRAKKGWLAHQVVARGIGHGNYPEEAASSGDSAPPVMRIQVWEYLALFVDKALTLRLPKDKYPTDAPLTLKQVDEASGFLIDPFAVEALLGMPKQPLVEEGGVYINNAGERSAVAGFAAIKPPQDYTPPEGVPVAALESGKSPVQWLVTDVMKSTMKDDPMTAPGAWKSLRPNVGDTVVIDGNTLTFKAIKPKQMAKNGGIALAQGRNSLLAYTVVELAERKFVKVNAGFTAATRIQMIVNGVPVKHKQVLELEPGRYPLMVALSMGVYWDRIEPNLSIATDEEVAEAKRLQQEAGKTAAAAQTGKADAPNAARALVLPAADVRKEDRSRMFWVADREQADAWLLLHTAPGAKKESGGTVPVKPQ